MRLHFRNFVFSTLALFFLFIATPPLYADIVGRIVAIVGEDIITQNDLDRLLAFHLSELHQLSTPQEKEIRLKQLRAQALDELIQQTLLNRKIAKSKIEVSDKDLAAAINNMLAQNRVTLEQLKQDLTKNGVSFETYKENLRNQMRQYKFVQREIQPKVQVTEADLSDYYNKHASDFQSFKSVRFSQLLLSPTSTRGMAETIDFAQQLRADIVAKKFSFADAARKYSEAPNAAQGGDSGWLTASDVNPQLLQLLSSMKPKELSPPLPTQNTVLLVQLEDRKDPTKSDFTAVKKEIENRVFKEKMDAELAKYLTSLREKAYVQILK